jgi:hypothetical protein
MKQYKSVISLSKNGRGIWDFDTTKGCSNGIAQMGERGCYDDCYAARSAKIRGYDFGKTVLRDFTGVAHQRKVIDQINRIDSSFIRIGCSGDPSEDWNHTFSILRKIARCDKEIVIITKHWHVMTDQQIHELKALRVHVNTSVSALDSPAQLEKCLLEYWRLKPFCTWCHAILIKVTPKDLGCL